MTTLLLHHSCFANHQTAHGHPERPDRYRVVESVLGRPEFDPLVREEAELAERLGVSRQTVNAVETGRYDPSLPLAFAIARVFKLPIERIFTAE